MKRCTSCSRLMRPRTVSKAEAPDTVAVGSGGLCMGCLQRTGGGEATAQVDDSPCILTRVDLRPSTYQALARFAKENHTTVGAVLSVLADRAIQPRTKRTRVPLAEDVDEKIRALNAAGLSDNKIGKQLGIAQSTVSKRRRDMRLESPTPRVGGRQRAA